MKKKPIVSPAECYNCPNNQGLDILQYYIVRKSDSAIISLTEEACYDCSLFGLVHEDDECCNVRPTKEPTVNIVKWEAM